MSDPTPIEARTVASLSRLERRFLKARYCSFCEANLLGSLCYAQSGEYALPILEGVRDEEVIVDLGPPCNMDERRGHALRHYKPRAARSVAAHPAAHFNREEA